MLKKNQIFISWSKDNSRYIAFALKEVLEKVIFKDCNLKAFMSDKDVPSGSDWYNTIKDELLSSKFGIICVTKENKDAPWLQFESGALIANDLNVTPVLFHCSWTPNDEGNPLRSRQSVLYQEENFIKLIEDINKTLHLGKDSDQLKILARESYKILAEKLKGILSKMDNEKMFSMKYVYPKWVKTVYKNSVYISAPMASVSCIEYSDINLAAKIVVDALKEIGFCDIKCPAAEIGSDYDFDGSTQTFKVTFEEMKKRDCYVLLFPEKVASGVLIELGYAIALSKKIAIFTHSIKNLPYIVQQPISNSNIKIYTYANYDDLVKIIKSNKMAIFDDNEEDS